MKVITTNTHVPYLHLLSKIPGIELAVFSFRFFGRDWQNVYRAKPSNLFHIPIDEKGIFYIILKDLIEAKIDYIVIHSMQDLEMFCDRKNYPEPMKGLYEKVQEVPKYFVFHNSIFTDFRSFPQQMYNVKRNELSGIFKENRITAVCISKWKAEGWQFPCHIIPPGIDTSEFPVCWSGINNNYKINDSFPNYSVRVCSNFEYRDFMNGYKNGNEVLAGIKYPNIILGEGNQNTRERIPQALFTISNSFEHYKVCMAQARLMFSANMSGFEDWYNLSSLEAIAMGVPMVFATHERMTVIPDFTKIFPLVSEDIGYLRERINNLFRDEGFARYISDKEAGFVDKHFSLSAFLTNWSTLLRVKK